jgi:hypothetical protein
LRYEIGELTSEGGLDKMSRKKEIKFRFVVNDTIILGFK